MDIKLQVHQDDDTSIFITTTVNDFSNLNQEQGHKLAKPDQGK